MSQDLSKQFINITNISFYQAVAAFYKDGQSIKSFKVKKDPALLGQLIKPYSTRTEGLVKYHIQPYKSHSNTMSTAVTAPRFEQRVQGRRMYTSRIPYLSFLEFYASSSFISSSQGSAESLRIPSSPNLKRRVLSQSFTNVFPYTVGSLFLILLGGTGLIVLVEQPFKTLPAMSDPSQNSKLFRFRQTILFVHKGFGKTFSFLQ